VSSAEWADRVHDEAVGALGRLLTDAGLRARLGEAGRRRLERKFSFEHFRGTLRRLYDQAMSAPHAD
jgi:hypothetical protein